MELDGEHVLGKMLKEAPTPPPPPTVETIYLSFIARLKKNYFEDSTVTSDDCKHLLVFLIHGIHITCDQSSW